MDQIEYTDPLYALQQYMKETSDTFRRCENDSVTIVPNHYTDPYTITVRWEAFRQRLYIACRFPLLESEVYEETLCELCQLIVKDSGNRYNIQVQEDVFFLGKIYRLEEKIAPPEIGAMVKGLVKVCRYYYPAVQCVGFGFPARAALTVSISKVYGYA